MSALAWTATSICAMRRRARAQDEWRVPQASIDALLEVIGEGLISAPEIARRLDRHPTHVLRILRAAIACGLIERRETGARRLATYRRTAGRRAS